MALKYGEYSDNALEKFSNIAKEEAEKTGKPVLLLCDVSGKLSIWKTSVRGEYKGKQKIVREF